jgi:hypothetical protein
MHHTIIALQATGVGGADVAPMIAGAGSGLDPTRTIIILAIAVVAIAVLYPIARAIAKRMERGASPSLPANKPDSDARLQRLEQSVEAMELELERIAEGQRYTTKLLTERLPLAARVPQPGQGEKTLL